MFHCQQTPVSISVDFIQPDTHLCCPVGVRATVDHSALSTDLNIFSKFQFEIFYLTTHVHIWYNFLYSYAFVYNSL